MALSVLTCVMVMRMILANDRIVCLQRTFRMIGFFRGFMVRLFNSVLLLCFALSLLVTSCSNAGVPLNGPPVVQETVSIELEEAVESSTESVSLEAAITGSGL